MSDVVTTRANDGSTVEFIYKDPMQGGVKDCYWTTDKSAVVAFYRNKLDYAGKDRIEKLVGQYRDGIFNQTGGSYWKDVFCWPEKIVEHDGRTGIVVPAYDKRFFFEADPLKGTEKDGKWFASAKNFNRFVPPSERGELRTFLRICLQLSRGVRRLHAAGLAHSDLSYRNCLIDPKSGSACIIDIDGLVVPGLFPPDVLGTPDFIAPEVVSSFALKDRSKRVLPSRSTDLHALAVLIYLYFLHRHPLRGDKIYSADPEIQEQMEMGEKALFVENPNDRSNRPKVKPEDSRCLPWIDLDKIPYETTGPYLKALFNQAFIDGLHNPFARPSAADWEDALLKTSDLMLPCDGSSCPKRWFVYDNKTRPSCPYCGKRYEKPLPVLDFYITRDGASFRPENRRAMVWSGQGVYKWHIDRAVVPNEKLSASEGKRLGYFVFHNSRWSLVNEGMPDLFDITNDKPIPPGGHIALTNGLRLRLAAGNTGRVANVQIANV